MVDLPLLTSNFLFMNTPLSSTVILIIANVIISFIGFNNRNFLNAFLMWPYYVKEKKEYYRFITSGFLHADMMHLFFNMFTLYFFGKNLEIILDFFNLGGTRIFIVLYLSAIIVSDIPSYFKQARHYGYRSLGASGAVSAIVFATILFSPWSTVQIYGVLRMSSALYAVLFIVYCMYMSKRGSDNINHDAHLWGALYGLGFMLVLVFLKQPYLLEKILEELKHPALFGK